MSILFWRKNKQIDAFAMMVADEFYSRLPPDVVKGHFELEAKDKQEKKREHKMSKKIGGLVVGTVSQIQQFRGQESLGVYGKARLHMKFKERLIELGYEKEITEQINEVIMLKTP